MELTDKPFADLTATDLMTADVITVSRHMSLRAAAHLLAQAGVSGAPVLDDAGRCVGVLSKSDLVRFLDRGPRECRCQGLLRKDIFADWQVDDLECLPAEEVGNYMTPKVVTAGPMTSVADLARILLHHRIHRVLITDTHHRIAGVVSSMDILGAVAVCEEQPLCD